MSKIFGIVGYACNGKSTVMNKIIAKTNYTIIDLPQIYKNLAFDKGFNGVTQYFSTIGLEQYRQETTQAVLEYIDTLECNDENLIIDDIFDTIIYDKLIKKYPHMKLIKFESSYEDRLKRLAIRAGINGYNELIAGLEKRDKMKEFCGIKDIFPLAHYTITNHGDIEKPCDELIKYLNQNTIICVAGLSGSGKSTIVTYLSKYYNIPVFYFGKNVTDISHNNGYQKSRHFVDDMGIDIYKQIIEEELFKRINEFRAKNSVFIIDGIFSINIFNKLKACDNIYNICVNLDEQTRIKRLANRENINFNEAENEIFQKDNTKIQCGVLEIMNNPDYTYNNDYNITEIQKKLSLKK